MYSYHYYYNYYYCAAAAGAAGAAGAAAAAPPAAAGALPLRAECALAAGSAVERPLEVGPPLS